MCGMSLTANAFTISGSMNAPGVCSRRRGVLADREVGGTSVL